MICLDLEYSSGEIKSDGVAFYRLPKEMKDFLAKVEKENKIIGFEYNSGEWNFGVILQKKDFKSSILIK